MTLVQENHHSSPLPEKKEAQGIISVQSMVTFPPEEDDIYEYPPIQEPSSECSDNISSSDVLLEHVASKLERQKSCESVGSMSEEEEEEESNPDDEDCHEEGSLSDEGNDLKRETSLEVGCERSTSVVSDASEEGARDSGIEAEKDPEMPPMLIPDQALMEKIVSQVEFYFGDANVVKDKFLLKHIRRNKEGYVSLKLVSSFKKVKQLTKDWRVVAYSLSKLSEFMQVNDQRTKIRRVKPLPEIDDSPVTCAVLALDLPLEKPSVETVSKLFGYVGDISFVRVLRAGGNLPPDVKSLLTKYPVLGEKHCAWIEFETPESAKAATEMPVEGNMRVVLIVPESQKKQEKTQQKQQSGSRKNSGNSNRQKLSTGSRKSSSGSNNGSYGYFYGRQRKDSHSHSHSNSHFYSHYEHDVRRPVQRRKAISLPSAQNPFMNDPSKRSEARKVRPKSKSCTDFPSGSPPTSWVQRHLLAAAAASAASAASPVVGSRPPTTRISRISVGSLPLSEGIVRFPKGPDGTRGFHRDTRHRQAMEKTSAHSGTTT